MVSVSVPIWLTLTRIELAMPSAMPSASRFSLVTNRSSPTSWMLPAEPLGQRSFQPAMSSSAMPVLDRRDRIIADQGRRNSRPSARASGVSLSPAMHIGAVLEEFGRRAVERDQHVVARRVAGALDRLQDEVERLRAPRRCSGAKPPSSPTAVDRPWLVQRGSSAHGKSPRRSAALRKSSPRRPASTMNSWKSMRIVGMRAAVEDVHHRHRQQIGVDPADIAVERQAARLGRRLGHRQADAEDRVGAEPALVVAAVERDHRRVDLGLVLGLVADDRVGDLAVDRCAPPRRRPCRPSGSCRRRAARPLHARRSRRPTAPRRGPSLPSSSVTSTSTVGIAAAVEDLAGVDVDDRGHDGWLFRAMVVTVPASIRRPAGRATFRLGRRNEARDSGFIEDEEGVCMMDDQNDRFPKAPTRSSPAPQ